MQEQSLEGLIGLEGYPVYSCHCILPFTSMVKMEGGGLRGGGWG